MVEWEYYRLNFVDCRKVNTTLVDEKRLLDKLNELGMQGWELVSYYHNWQYEIAGFAVLKRPFTSRAADTTLEEMSQELVRSD